MQLGNMTTVLNLQGNEVFIVPLDKYSYTRLNDKLVIMRNPDYKGEEEDEETYQDLEVDESECVDCVCESHDEESDDEESDNEESEYSECVDCVCESDDEESDDDSDYEESEDDDDSDYEESEKSEDNDESHYNIIKYHNCDVFRGNNNIQKKGFDGKLSEKHMIQLAIEHGCPLIVRSGIKGKWYLKGKGKSIDELKEKIEKNKGNSGDGVFTILLEFNE
jgi:hypothetical protein